MVSFDGTGRGSSILKTKFTLLINWTKHTLYYVIVNEYMIYEIYKLLTKLNRWKQSLNKKKTENILHINNMKE